MAQSMVHVWHFLGSTTLQALGKLTLREDAWWLPTGGERRVVPFSEAVAMALDDRITESVSKVALLATALRLGHRP
jgi:hypothetical protein